jgi:hypothetical protein
MKLRICSIKPFSLLFALLVLVLPVLAATNDNNIENHNGQPRHVPGEEAWVGAGFNMRNPTNVDDYDAPFFYTSVWANDITDMKFNTSANGWSEYQMVFDSDHDGKSYWRTSAGITEIQNQNPGTVVYYDFKLIDGTDVGWLKSDGFFDATGQGTPFSFTVEGVSASPSSATADSSATATITAWVTNAGQPVSGEVVTFTFASGPGAFVSTNNQTATATTDGNGKASVQIRSGAAGAAVINANSTNINDSGDDTALVTFSTFLTDGDDADFGGRTTGMSDNESRVVDGVFVWKDASNDYRPVAEIDNAFADADMKWFDIREVRFAASSDSFRAMVSFRDNESAKNPFVLITIDTNVRRDTSSTVTTAGPGPATSVQDSGQWWLPAGAMSGGRHIGGSGPEVRGEREQIDYSGGAADALLPNRWGMGDGAVDGGTDSITICFDTAVGVTSNRHDDASGGNPNYIKWDYNPMTHELYAAVTPWNTGGGSGSDIFIFLADETSTLNLPWDPGIWAKRGAVMDFDLMFARDGGPGTYGNDYIEIRRRNFGRVSGTVATAGGGGGGTPTAYVNGLDNDHDNRYQVYVSCGNEDPALEIVVDLDEVFGDTGVRNGDIFIAGGAYQPEDTSAGAGKGDNWDGVPQDYSSDHILDWKQFQQVRLEIPSQSSNEQVTEWERAIAFTPVANAADTNSGTAIWAAPGGAGLGAYRYVSTDNKSYGSSFLNVTNFDTFEYDVRWARLLGSGVRPPFTLRFQIAVGQGNSGLLGADQFDTPTYMRTYRPGATGTFGRVSSLLDVVSSATTSSEVSDSDLDYFVDVDFNFDGRINTTPDTPTNLGIIQTVDTTVKGTGSILNDATPIFRWTVNDTDGSLSAKNPAWHLQVDNDAAFGSPNLTMTSTNTDSNLTEKEASGAIGTGDTFYWRVRTRDDFGWGPWSKGSDFSFRINSPPSIPADRRVDSQTNSLSIVDNSVRFTWNFGDSDPNDAQTGFSVEIWDGATRVHAETQLTTNLYWDYPDTAPALEGGRTYFWNIRAKDLNGAYGPYSDSTGTYFQIVFDSSTGIRNVVIAEVGNGYATTAGQDYLELYNPNDTTVQLKGASLQYVAVNSGTFRKWIFTSNDSIPAYSYYLFTSWAVAGRDSHSANFAFTVNQGHVFALMRNSIQIDTPQSADTDIIDAVGINQVADGTNVPVTAMNANDELIIRKSTSGSNVVLGMRRDSDLRHAGSYFDNNDANDWDNTQTVSLAELRGVSFGPSRIRFTVPRADSYVEQGCTFTLRIRADDAIGWKVSDTPASSMTGNARLAISAGTILPTTTTDTFNTFSTSNALNGIVDESVCITGALGEVLIRVDTTYGTDSTGLGPINGSCSVIVQPPQAPTKPVISYPTEGLYPFNPLTVTWSASTDSTPPVLYRVQVSSDSIFSALVADTTTYSTSQSIGPLTLGDSFWLRVTAADPGGNTDTSTTIRFRACTAVASFALYETDPVLSAPSRSVRRGQAFNLRIIARSVTGGTVTTFQDTVMLTVARGTITPDSVKFTLADGGETTCSVTISGGGAVGQDTISADSGAITGKTVVIPLSENRLVINEILPVDVNNPGNVDRDEWFEIWNRSVETVAISGWLGTDYSTGETNLPAVSIPAGKAVVVHTSETGTNDYDFGDTDQSAHVFVFPTVLNRLSHTDRLGLYSSTTKDSTTIVSYVSWSDQSTRATADDADAVGAGLWTDDQDYNHGYGTALAMAGIPVFRSTNGSDSLVARGDWNQRGATDTYCFTEGFSNELVDTNLTGVTVTLRSLSGSSDTVALGERMLVTVTATGGGNGAVRGVTTVRVRSLADDTGIIVTLWETANGSRVYNQEITVFSIAETGTRDGHREIGVNPIDTITVYWIKSDSKAVAVTAGPLHHFDVIAPTYVSNGSAFSITIYARTAGGSTKTDYTGTVNLTVSNGSISPLTAVFAASESGAKAVTVTITGAAFGQDTITVTEASTGETGVRAVTVTGLLNIAINEIMPKPAGTDWDGSGAVDVNQDEWVELFNRADSAITVASWKVGANGTSKVTLADTIPARGYLVVYRRGAGTAGGFFFDSNGVVTQSMTFGAGALGPLGDGGDRVFLLNAAGDTFDDVTYTSMSASPDSSYVRAWDGAGVFRSPVRATPGDSPTLPTSQRDTSANMRFRVAEPDTAVLNESTTLRILAVDAAGNTVTDFTSSGISVTSSGGPTINISTVTFTNGVCSTSVRFQTATGTATLVVRFETNTVGSDTVIVSPAPSTDTTPPAKPTGFSATAVLVNAPPQDTGVRLTWTSNTETDVAQYKLYRNSVNDTRAAGMTLIFTGLVSDTTRLDSSVLPNDTAYYYLVAIDSAGNISETAGAVTAPAFTVQKTIDSTSLGLLPGSSILYRLAVENAGWGPADSVAVMDTIAANMVYRDTVTTVADWEFQYCTSATPSQAFYSADYVSGVPVVASDVRFVRWRKLRVTVAEPVAVLRFRTILE